MHALFLTSFRRRVRMHQALGALVAVAAMIGLTATGCGDTTGTTDVSCTDRIKNGSETDIDCGGGSCVPCADGNACTEGANCASGVCKDGVCHAPACNDGVLNGGETSIDCGGACVQPEICNGQDDDCNGLIDDGLLSMTCGIGACQQTVDACTTGQPSKCEPNTAGTEACDGLLDEDCDGVVDNGCACKDGATQSCYGGSMSTLDVGACKAGTQACTAGEWGICEGDVTPQAETCDGIDNDCNAATDEGNPGGGAACSTGMSGICANGTSACSGGTIVCNQNMQSSAEACDGLLDENCNGTIDEGCACTNGAMQSCYTGSPGTAGVGPCKTGLQTCSNGMWSMCAGQVLPATETCNGIDDDCDGSTDDGNPGGGGACGTGNLGICAAGTLTCSSGALNCLQNAPPAPSENCGTPDDDNCNGQVNENCSFCTPFSTRTCYTGAAGTSGVGVCKSGTQTCNAAGTAWGPCNGEIVPSAESCQNNLDDNCNGQTNEGCAALTCPNFYIEDFNDGTASSLTSGVYKVDWCNSYVATPANTPLCMLPGQTTRTNATGGTNAYVGIWVHKATASCSAVRLTYDWYQFANAGAVVEYKQTTDSFASSASCSTSSGWTNAVTSASMSTLQTCSSTMNINIPFGSSTGVYIKFKSTNAQNNAMWWDNIKLTLVGCDC